MIILSFQKKRNVSTTVAVTEEEEEEEEIEKELAFECKRGDIVAIYANEKESRRFWIAEAAGVIRKGNRDNQTFGIFYYAATDKDYTIFKPEGGTKEKSKVFYSQCLCPVVPLSRKEDEIVITPLIRDKLTRLGIRLDEEV